MNDVFTEQLIVKKPDVRSTWMRLLIAAAGFVVTCLPFIIDVLFIPPESQGRLLLYTPLTLAVSIFGVVMLLRRMNIEYEYILTNGELDVDKIIGRRSRKRLINSANCRNFDILTPVTAKSLHHYKNNRYKSMDVSSSPDAANLWFAVFNGKKGAKIALIFEPNEKMLEQIKKFVPRSNIQA